MLAYYAAGGGLGHLTRARAVAPSATLVTASPYADDPRVTGGLPVLRIPDAGYGSWLQRQLPAFAELWVDAFPGGVVGELCGLDLSGVRLVHVARRLRWDVYASRLDGPLPRYERTWVLEPLEDEHAEALAGCSDSVEPLSLEVEPPAPVELDRDGRPLWLVVHSGPEPEVADLLAYARSQREAEDASARIVVVSPCPPPETEAIDFYPAAALYPGADRIYTACGFNAMRETEPWRERHRFVPYPRVLDDQYARAAMARAATTTSASPAPRRAAPRPG